MHWIWLDRILELQRGERCVAIKNVTAAEDVLHDHFPATPASNDTPGHPAIPCMPHTLIIEGMAQTAGIMVGHARDFQEKVILAKIGKAVFTDALATPGTTIRHTATLSYIDDRGGSATGVTELLDPVTGDASPFAEIDLMFSHIDRNAQGLTFPEHNFVFTDQFMDLMRRSGVA